MDQLIINTKTIRASCFHEPPRGWGEIEVGWVENGTLITRRVSDLIKPSPNTPEELRQFGTFENRAGRGDQVVLACFGGSDFSGAIHPIYIQRVLHHSKIGAQLPGRLIEVPGTQDGAPHGQFMVKVIVAEAGGSIRERWAAFALDSAGKVAREVTERFLSRKPEERAVTVEVTGLQPIQYKVIQFG